MRFTILNIGVLISIIFASMKAAGVPTFAAWSWWAVFAYPIGWSLVVAVCLFAVLLVLSAFASE